MMYLPPGGQVDSLNVDNNFFENLDWDDLWEDARMDSVIDYLKSNRHLVYPNHINLKRITRHVSQAA